MGKSNIRYVAILRGINVSGKNIIRMEELRQLFAAMGFSDVATYIQSGNVLFTSSGSDEEKLVKQVSGGIRKQFGLEVPVIIRSEKEMKGIVEGNPFLREKDILVDKLHVTFLPDIPAAEFAAAVESFDAGNDRFILNGREIYLYCPGGYGNTLLSNTFFEKKLKTTATTRNWNTVNKLLELLYHPGSNIQHPTSNIKTK